MRTTIDLPRELLEQVQQMTGAATRKEALRVALEDYVRRQRVQRVLEVAGTLEFDMEARDIRRLDARRRQVD